MKKQNKKVMIIEDEALLLQAIEKKLQANNLETISFKKAEQALSYLEEYEEMPDLIWLDYYLDGMDGLAFMKKLQEQPKWKEIPVLVISNSASPEKVNTMLSLGVSKYLLKAEHRLEEIINIIGEITKAKVLS